MPRASTISLPVVITKNVSRYYQMSLRGQSHPRVRSNEEDGLRYHNLLASCIYLDLDLSSFICSHLHVILLDQKISFPLMFDVGILLDNFGLGCSRLCLALSTFASTFNQSLHCKTYPQGGLSWFVSLPDLPEISKADYITLRGGNDLISGEF